MVELAPSGEAHLGAPGEAPLERSASPRTGAVTDRPAQVSLQASPSGFLSGSHFGLSGYRDPLSLLLELRQVLHRQAQLNGCRVPLVLTPHKHPCRLLND